jgi:hypothetical protein
VADAIVEENAEARIDGLRAALAVLGLLAVLAFVAARRLPTVQPSDPRFAEALVTDEEPRPASHRPLRRGRRDG